MTRKTKNQKPEKPLSAHTHTHARADHNIVYVLSAYGTHYEVRLSVLSISLISSRGSFQQSKYISKLTKC